MEAPQEQPPEQVSRIARLLGQIVEAELLFAWTGEVVIPLNPPESPRNRLSLRDWFELRMLQTVPFKDDMPGK